MVVILASSVKQFFDPAEQSVLPDVASEEELAAANAFLSISSFGSTAIGFAAAGFLASTGEIAVAFYVDALTFLISAACVSLVKIAPMVIEEETSVSAVVANLKSGVGLLVRTPILRSTLIVFAPGPLRRSACGTSCCCRSRSTPSAAPSSSTGSRRA